ncbi:MAG TPA: hypothetical protein VFU28_19385 [Vicinamibacterales bacterium]|nr:hypothetical protein [Vicinamibacterales bacterium]
MTTLPPSAAGFVTSSRRSLKVVANKDPPKGEFGQATKASQRLGIDVHPETSEDIPAEILIDDSHKVKFPSGQVRAQITGVLAATERSESCLRPFGVSRAFAST